MNIFKSQLKKVLSEKFLLRLRTLFPKQCRKGENTFIAPHVQLIGVDNIKLGSNTCISEHCWLNVNHRIPNNVSIEVGNYCFIGRRNFFSSGHKITLGDYVLTANDCKFVCSSHLIDDPTIAYLNAGTTDTDSITIGHNCFFGAGSMVFGNLNIGHGSVIGAGALLIDSIPPFSIAVGNPAKVIKRFSFSKNEWIPTDDVSDQDLLENPDESEYLKLLLERNEQLHVPLVVTSSSFGNI